MSKHAYINQDRLFFSVFAFHGNEENTKLREALTGTTREALSPYLDFLDTAIQAEQKRGEYACRFRIVTRQSYEVRPTTRVYRLERPMEQVVLSPGPEALKETKNRLFMESSEATISFDRTTIIPIENGQSFLFPEDTPKLAALREAVNEGTLIELNNEPVACAIRNLDLLIGHQLVQGNRKTTVKKIIGSDDSGWIVELDPPLDAKGDAICQGFKVPLTVEPTNPKELFIQQAGAQPVPWDFERKDGSYYSDQDPKGAPLMDGTGRVYACHPKANKSDVLSIELIDDDVPEGEVPVSDHFLNQDDLRLYQGNNHRITFDCCRIHADERRIDVRLPKIYSHSDGDQKPTLDPSQPIKMLVDTANLRRQKAAVLALAMKPIQSQRNLIKLFEKTDQPNLWPQNPPREIGEGRWMVLRDAASPGTEAQRSFVRKALASRDFSLLEGPPGSGKTTTILELICQLIGQGQRVLLTASTHVAIDNILDELKPEWNVVPLRIGHSDSVGESVAGYTIAAKIEKLVRKGLSQDAAERCVLDSANLVCGTTMGIQNHPDIRGSRDSQDERDRPIQPRYDCMIIDEASKTTFQEFLVPAMHAKKWIIVGDIQQLSPFSEPELLRHSLQSIIPSPEQEALRWLHLWAETMRRNPEKVAVELPCSVILAMRSYIAGDSGQPEGQRRYQGILPAMYTAKTGWFSCDSPDAKLHPAKLYASQILVFEEGSWPSVKGQIPESHLLFPRNGSAQDEAFIRRQSYLDRTVERRKAREESFRALQEESRKNWADEMAWRMIRVFERRNLKQESYFERSLNILRPLGNPEALNKLDRISNLFFPSILESLQKGNGEEHRSNTTITDGFGLNTPAFKERFERLDYQHRMHPDISRFSREHFYTGKDGLPPLMDSPLMEIKRDWGFTRYESRAVWIDVVKSKARKEKDNQNEDEADRLLTELEAFVAWAEQNDKPDGKPWTVGVLTYYRPQEALLREKLRAFCSQRQKISLFQKGKIGIQLFTVDKFQGRQADVIYLSMVKNQKIGFMDNTNRLNVALTRARFQRVVIGNRKFFADQRQSEILRDLAIHSEAL